MGKFPRIVEWVLKGEELAGKIFKKRHLPFSVVVLAIAASSYFVYSQPSFYAQAQEERKIETGNGLRLFAGYGGLAVESTDDLKYTPAKEIRKPKGIFQKKNDEFEKELYAIVGNHPIKEMVPFIAEKDRTVAAFIIGIAKKESNWGKRVPTLNGQDCYNYWGYKGAGEKGVAMGHGCFATPEEAVNVIGRRIEQLVNKNLTTPSKMVVWKCGSSCAATGGQAAANKWISDISLYFNKIVKKEA